MKHLIKVLFVLLFFYSHELVAQNKKLKISDMQEFEKLFVKIYNNESDYKIGDFIIEAQSAKVLKDSCARYPYSGYSKERNQLTSYFYRVRTTLLPFINDSIKLQLDSTSNYLGERRKCKYGGTNLYFHCGQYNFRFDLYNLTFSEGFEHGCILRSMRCYVLVSNRDPKKPHYLEISDKEKLKNYCSNFRFLSILGFLNKIGVCENNSMQTWEPHK